MAEGGQPEEIKHASTSQHYEWNRETAERRAELEKLGVDTAPKPVEQAAAPAVDRNESGMSAWNHGGTWEDKDLSKWAQDEMAARLRAFQPEVPLSGMGCVLTLEEVKVEGDASVVYSRRKPKPGFDLTAKADWKLREGAADGAVAASGKLELHDMEYYDVEDMQIAVTADGGADAARAGVVALRERLIELVQEFKEMMLERAKGN